MRKGGSATNPIAWYWGWVIGSSDVSVTIALDWRRSYLVTGGLTLTEGSNYAHVYIAQVCYYSGGDVVRCGIRDVGDDFGQSVHEFISGANRVTIKLRAKGGKHRAEGAVYAL